MISPDGPMSPATRASPTGRGDLRPEEHGGGAVDLRHPALQVVHAKARPVGPERVGHHDPRAGIQVAPVDAPHDVRSVEVPDLGRVAELEAGGEEHGAHRAIRKDRAALIQERLPTVTHARHDTVATGVAESAAGHGSPGSGTIEASIVFQASHTAGRYANGIVKSPP